jgi:hypothetical protein
VSTKKADGEEKLERQLWEVIDFFDEESNKHKSRYRRCQTLIIALMATTTIVAGLGLILPVSGKAIEFAVLCLTASSTAVAAWTEMRRLQELWHRNRQAHHALCDIQREMEFVKANEGGLKPGDLRRLFDRMAAVLAASSEEWMRIVEQKVAEPQAPSAGSTT